MATVSLTGSDSIVINNTPITDLADGNVVELTFPNDVATVKTGKDGNSIYALNEQGRQADCKIRVLRGSASDKFLLGLFNLQKNNFAGFPLMFADFVKKIGDGSGNITSDTYICTGGIFTKPQEAKSNVDGDTDQSTATYIMKFSNAPRTLT